MYLINPNRWRARTYKIISAIIIAIRYQDLTFKLALNLYYKVSAPIGDFKTFHWLSHVTCFRCQTEAFTAVFSQRWNYRSVRVITDFYIRVLKFEKDPDVTSHKPNQSYTEPIVAVLIPNRKAACGGFEVRFMRTRFLSSTCSLFKQTCFQL